MNAWYIEPGNRDNKETSESFIRYTQNGNYEIHPVIPLGIEFEFVAGDSKDRSFFREHVPQPEDPQSDYIFVKINNSGYSKESLPSWLYMLGGFYNKKDGDVKGQVRKTAQKFAKEDGWKYDADRDGLPWLPVGDDQETIQ